MFGCACARCEKLHERLVHSLTVLAVGLNPISSVPIVRGQGILRQWGDRGRHSGNYFSAHFRIIGDS